MKKILSILLLFSICFVSCKKKGCIDSSASNYDSNAKTNDGSCVYTNSSSQDSSSGDFMFSITIDGITHKTEGAFSTNSNSGATNQLENHCYYMTGGYIYSGIVDTSVGSYISGEIFRLQIKFDSLSVGSSQAKITYLNSSNLTFPDGIDLNRGFSNTIDTIAITNIQNYESVNFDITDLGSPGSTSTSGDIDNFYIYGKPIIGSYSGILYGTNGTTYIPNQGYIYNIPIPIEIEFEAARYY
tara:strand:+ start:934 stop:1659 length:726 start_codon:yes stop_codon:yes gene_type:complete